MRYPTIESIKTGQDIELGRYPFSRTTALLFLRSAEGHFTIASARSDQTGNWEIMRSWFAQPSQFGRLRKAFLDACAAYEAAGYDDEAGQ